MHVGFQHGPLPLRFNFLLDFAAGFFDHFFNACRVNAPVGNQALQRHPPNFTADWVVGREGDGLRRVVNNEVDAGRCLYGTDVAAFPPDNPGPSFRHWAAVRPKRSPLRRYLQHILHREGNKVARFGFGFIFELKLIVLNFQCFSWTSSPSRYPAAVVWPVPP